MQYLSCRVGTVSEILIFKSVYSIAVDVVTVGRQFFGYVGRDQDHERQRHGESENVDRRIKSVTVQESQEKLEVKRVFHRIKSRLVLDYDRKFSGVGSYSVLIDLTGFSAAVR